MQVKVGHLLVMITFIWEGDKINTKMGQWSMVGYKILIGHYHCFTETS